MSSDVAGIAAHAHTSQRDALAKWIGYVILVDLLFLPYFQLMIMPFSLPLLFGAFLLLNPPLRNDRYLVLLFLITFTVFVSVGISLVRSESVEYQMENFKRAIQLVSSFAYFIYFRWLATHAKLRTERLATWFVVWFGFLAVAFFLDPAGMGETIRAFYGRLVTGEEVIAEHMRFAYQFTDPNTAAYFLLIAASPLLLEKRGGGLAVLILVLMGLIFVTQSRGGLIALLLMVLLTIYSPERFVASFFSVRRISLIVALGLILTLLMLAVTSVVESNAVLLAAYERIFDAPEQYTSGGSRFQTWALFFESFSPLPVGRGFMLIINGVPERPHSDLLRLLFSYGVIALIAALLFLFGRLRSFPVLILPALMAFLINSLIDEQKLLGLFLALLGICEGNKLRCGATAPPRRHAHAA